MGKEDKAKDDKGAKAPEPPKLPPTPQDVLHRNIFLLDKYAETRDARFLARVMRYTKFLRLHLPTAALRAAVDTYVSDAAHRAAVHGLVNAAAEKRKEPEAPKAAAPAPAGSGAMEVEGGDAAAAAPAPAAAPAAVKAPKPSPASAPEVEVYLAYVALSELQAQGAGGNWGALAEGAAAVNGWVGGYNRRTLDFLSARLHAMRLTAVEALGVPGAPEALVPELLAAHRSAVLRHDEYGQATLLNLVCRVYLAGGQFDPAAKLLAKATFPEGASSAQLARHLLYRGRVQAVALDYSDAFASLTQAARKAPPAAVGFRVAATKFAVIAQLLTGEVPDRATFEGPMARPLAPYLALASAVRAGDLPAFRGALAAHGGVYAADRTLALVQRLEANVIMAGLRSLAVAYSRISFGAIATKLGLGSPEDAEFLCAKAIRDGVVDAVLDHEAGALASQETANVYATREPQEAFHKRISFLLDVHSEAQRGMRYPPNAGRADLESAEARREREREEEELAKDIEDGKFDDDEGDDDGPM